MNFKLTQVPFTKMDVLLDLNRFIKDTVNQAIAEGHWNITEPVVKTFVDNKEISVTCTIKSESLSIFIHHTHSNYNSSLVRMRMYFDRNNLGVMDYQKREIALPSEVPLQQIESIDAIGVKGEAHKNSLSITIAILKFMELMVCEMDNYAVMVADHTKKLIESGQSERVMGA